MTISPLVLLIGAMALGAVGLPLLIWGTWGDPARGRQRCRACWYDVSGAVRGPVMPCPECGTLLVVPYDLTRTRRRLDLAALGLGACVAALVLVARWVLATQALWTLVPTATLVSWSGPNAPQAVRQEIARRLMEPGLATADLERLAWGSGLVAVPPRWPEGRPVPVRWAAPVTRTGPLDVLGGAVGTVTVTVRPASPLVAWPPRSDPAISSERFWEGDRGPKFPAGGEVAFDVVREWVPGPGPASVLYQPGREAATLRVPVDGTASAGSVLTPASGPEIDQVVAAAVRLRPVRLPSSRQAGVLVLVEFPRLPPRLVLGMVIEFRVRDELVGRARVWVTADNAYGVAQTPVFIEGDAERVLEAWRSGLSVTLVGDPALALEGWWPEHDPLAKCWEGRAEMPGFGLPRP